MLGMQVEVKGVVLSDGLATDVNSHYAGCSMLDSDARCRQRYDCVSDRFCNIPHGSCVEPDRTSVGSQQVLAGATNYSAVPS